MSNYGSWGGEQQPQTGPPGGQEPAPWARQPPGQYGEPGYGQGQPGYGDQRGYDQGQPGYDQGYAGQPGYGQGYPGYDQGYGGQPGFGPGHPGYDPGYGGQPGYGNEQPAQWATGQPQEPQRGSKRGLLVGLLALLAVAAAGLGVYFFTRPDSGATGAASGPSTSASARASGATTAAPTPSAATPANPATSLPPTAGPGAPTAPGSVGAAVVDGDFEFRPTRVSCGRESVGTSITVTAQGQFCVVSLSVRNVGRESKSLSPANQFVYDGQNRRFGADARAMGYINSDESVFNKTISPGSFVEGVVIFDVFRDSSPARLEFHDSEFGTGSVVAVAPGEVVREGPLSSAVPAPSAPSATSSAAYWTVIVASSPTRAGAEAVAARLRDAGYPANEVFLSSQFSSLTPGVWVASTGSYATSREAAARVRTIRSTTSEFASGDNIAYHRCVGTAQACRAQGQ